MSTAIQSNGVVNGINAATLNQLVSNCQADARNAKVGFAVATQWRGGTKSETSVEGYTLGGRTIRRKFAIVADEPTELCGQNTAPNPQELLMAALNSCMMVGYIAGATVRGIELESVTIETEGELDLRGFLGLDPKVKPGYDVVHYTVRIKGNGTAEQFEEIHEAVIATSPNRFNLSQPIKLTSDLVIE